MDSKKVTVWVKQDVNGSYFVYGTYFYKEREGDIPAHTKYSFSEEGIKDELEDLQNQDLLQLKRKINQVAKRNNKKAIIKIIK